MKPFTDKYAPKKPSEIIGQEEALKQLGLFASNFKLSKKKAAMLYGPSGTGKTSAAYAVAKQHSWEVVEVNASDFRTAAEIDSVVGGAIKQQSLFSTGKLILVDEIDGLAGNQDRGGAQALVKLIEETKFPVVLTATNPYDHKLSSLKSKSVLVEFSALEPENILSILKHICTSEKIPYEDDALMMLARRAGGDARAAINNLQVMSIVAGKLTKGAVEELSDRDRTENIMTAIQKVFKTTSLEVATKAFETVEEDTDEQFFWLDENLPKEYTNPEDLARAYDSLSKADIFKSRIRRWQHWRFLVYVSALLSGGVAVAKTTKNPAFVEYKPTGRILKMWWAKQKSMKKKAIAAKIAHKTHSSIKDVVTSTMPYVIYTFKNDKGFQTQFIEEFDLDEEEVEWMRKAALSV
jgi:replication factor C large subunit